MSRRPLPAWLRGILGVLAIFLLLAVVSNIIGDYRAGKRAGEALPGEGTTTVAPGGETTAQPGNGSGAATKTPDAAPAAASGRVVVVQIDGLNFRREPKASGSVIRGLDAGEKLEHVETSGGWYRVKDADGTLGWVSANEQYTTLEGQ